MIHHAISSANRLQGQRPLSAIRVPGHPRHHSEQSGATRHSAGPGSAFRASPCEVVAQTSITASSDSVLSPSIATSTGDPSSPVFSGRRRFPRRCGFGFGISGGLSLSFGLGCQFIRVTVECRRELILRLCTPGMSYEDGMILSTTLARPIESPQL